MEDREVLHRYWEGRSDNPTIQSMMLNQNAELIDEADRMEVMEGLPDSLSGTTILEVGAGIGRFTRSIAQKAKKVIATDFIESFIALNKETNESLGNITFLTGDAVTLEQPAESLDIVFTNWLLMYFTDTELVTFLFNVISWLRPNGYLHLRESCTESSSRRKPVGPGTSNPTRYRHISQYLDVFDYIRWRDANGKLWKIQPLWARSIDVYVEKQENWRQCQIGLRKVRCMDTDPVHSHSNVITMLEMSAKKQANVDRAFFSLVMLPLTSWELLLVQKITKKFSTPKEVRILNLCPSLINPFRIAQKLGCSIAAATSDCYAYAGHLTCANTLKDQNIRVYWCQQFNTDCSRLQANAYDIVCFSAENVTAEFDEFIQASDAYNCTWCLQPINLEASISGALLDVAQECSGSTLATTPQELQTIA